MTNSLIPVFNGSISNVSIQLCNARELHSFLEIGKQYGTWITDRITDYGFVQDEDYIIVTERTNGRPRKEYHITLDMGKELAMVERNEKGRQIRKYFIECEREMKRLQKEAENLPLADRKTTVDERTGLRNAVNMLVSKKGLLYNEAYNLVHHYMNVESIEDIPAEKLPMAVEYVHKICLEGELITEPRVEPKINIELTSKQLATFLNVWSQFALLAESLPPLLSKAQYFIHGNTLSLPDFHLSRCQQALRDSHPTVLKFLDNLPTEQSLHYSRERIRHIV